MEVVDLSEECLHCRASQPPQAGTIVGGDHQGVRRSLVVALKHGGRDELALVLGEPLARQIMRRGDPARVDVVTPVPSHPLHRLRRGWSAAALLAAVVAERLGLPRAALLRRRGLARQVGRTRRQRLALAPHRFAARRHLRGTEVLLVDDVTTTGATLRRASEVLLAAGAARVWCAVAAAAPDARRST